MRSPRISGLHLSVFDCAHRLSPFGLGLCSPPLTFRFLTVLIGSHLSVFTVLIGSHLSVWGCAHRLSPFGLGLCSPPSSSSSWVLGPPAAFGSSDTRMPLTLLAELARDSDLQLCNTAAGGISWPRRSRRTSLPVIQNYERRALGMKAATQRCLW